MTKTALKKMIREIGYDPSDALLAYVQEELEKAITPKLVKAAFARWEVEKAKAAIIPPPPKNGAKETATAAKPAATAKPKGKGKDKPGTPATPVATGDKAKNKGGRPTKEEVAARTAAKAQDGEPKPPEQIAEEAKKLEQGGGGGGNLSTPADPKSLGTQQPVAAAPPAGTGGSGAGA